jgi:PKD repeat protein
LTIAFRPNAVFQNIPSGISPQFTWDFGDGTTSNLRDPTHTYTQAGTYTPSLKISIENIIKEFALNPINVIQLIPTISANPAASTYSGNAPLSASFRPQATFTNVPSGASPLFTWDFGDGTTSNLRDPTHTYTEAGKFIPTLEIALAGVKKDFTLSPITSNATGIIQATPKFSSANQHAPMDVLFTPNLSKAQILGVTSNPIVNYTWDFGDGTTSNLRDPTHTYTNTTPNSLVYTPKLLIEIESGAYKFSKTFNLPFLTVPVMWPASIVIGPAQPQGGCNNYYTITVLDRHNNPVPNTRVALQGNILDVEHNSSIITTDENGQGTFNLHECICGTASFSLRSLRNPSVTNSGGGQPPC